MSDPAVTGKIIKALADYLRRNPESIEPDQHLRDDLGLEEGDTMTVRVEESSSGTRQLVLWRAEATATGEED